MLRFLCASALALAGCTVGGSGSAHDFGGLPGDGGTPSSDLAGAAAADMLAPPADLTVLPDLGGHLNVVASDPTGTVNLSSEGSADWVHWGLAGENSVTRKMGVSPLISEVTRIGTGDFHQYTDNHVVWVWSDGAPIMSNGGTPTGIFILGPGNGFMLSVPASPQMRTLRIYLSGYASDFKVTAHISDGTALDFTDTVKGSTTEAWTYRSYTFVYKSLTPGQTLEVSWVDLKDYFGGGNVTLQSATLQ